MALGVGQSLILNNRRGGGLNAAYKTVLESWTNQPSDTVKVGQNELFKKMTSRTYWDKMDAAWFYGLPETNAGGEALVNIKSPGTNDSTEVNSPYFNAFSGFKGDASTMYLNTNWNGTDDGVKYKLNDAHFSIYDLDKVEILAAKGNGTVTGDQDTFLAPFYSDNGLYRINGGNQVSPAINDITQGLVIVNSDNETKSSLYKNSIYNQTDVIKEDLNNLDLTLLRYSTSNNDERIGFASVGGALTEAECIQLEADLDWWFNFEWLSLGSELITNGDFATDSDWTKGTGWTIGSGVASCDGSQSADSSLTQTSILTSGKWYLVELDYDSITAGGVKVGALTNEIGTNGTCRFVFEASGTDFSITGNSAFIGNVDNVSVKEIIGL